MAGVSCRVCETIFVDCVCHTQQQRHQTNFSTAMNNVGWLACSVHKLKCIGLHVCFDINRAHRPIRQTAIGHVTKCMSCWVNKHQKSSRLPNVVAFILVDPTHDQETYVVVYKNKLDKVFAIMDLRKNSIRKFTKFREIKSVFCHVVKTAFDRNDVHVGTCRPKKILLITILVLAQLGLQRENGLRKVLQPAVVVFHLCHDLAQSPKAEPRLVVVFISKITDKRINLQKLKTKLVH